MAGLFFVITMEQTKKTIKKSLRDKIVKTGRFIGNTPLLPVENFELADQTSLSAKAEWLQLGGSVKARPAWQIIKSAIFEGQLSENKTLLDASSGNTAIAYAMIAARLNIPCHICIPENVSAERISMLKAFNAELTFTPAGESTEGASAQAAKMKEEHPDKFYFADQYSNEANSYAHEVTTGPEIFRQTDGKITHFVAGLGTTGTITGTARYLKQKNPEIQIIALQPDSPMHILEGWKELETAGTPAIFDEKWIDDFQYVSSEDSLNLIKNIAEKEGVLLSPSAAANFAGALKIAQNVPYSNVVTIFPDDFSKYSEILKNIL